MFVIFYLLLIVAFMLIKVQDTLRDYRGLILFTSKNYRSNK